jgi:hypothetical protein
LPSVDERNSPPEKEEADSATPVKAGEGGEV